MHDVDRTRLELETDTYGEYELPDVAEAEAEWSEEEAQFGADPYGEFGSADGAEWEAGWGGEIDRYEAEPSGEYATSDESEWEAGWSAEASGPLDEAEEMELAAQLLEVRDDSELDQFLGGLIRRVGRGVGRFVRSSTGRALSRILAQAAKRALPVIGSAGGMFLGGPAGAMAGGRLASTAGRMLGLELEGLSPEDQEFEVARGVVRLAGEATRRAAMAPASVPGQVAATRAVAAAARSYAPGLLRALGSGLGARPKSGRWVRQGPRIVLFGV